MKQILKKGMILLSVLHIFLWCVLFLDLVVDLVLYEPNPGDDIFGSAFDYRIFLMLSVFIGCAILTATLLFFSLRYALFPSRDETRSIRTANLCFSSIATGVLYLFLFLLFVINKDWVFIPTLILALIWFLCVIFCGSLLVVLSEKKNSGGEGS